MGKLLIGKQEKKEAKIDEFVELLTTIMSDLAPACKVPPVLSNKLKELLHAIL